MQKALVQMNLQLTQVVSDITGVTGLRIMRDIVAGQRDPQQLARASGSRCRASHGRDRRGVDGPLSAGALFVLQQNLELFDACQPQLAACDRAIEAHVATLTAAGRPPPRPLPGLAAPRAKPRDNEPGFEIRIPLHHLTGGVDLTQIDGIAPYTALKLVAEIGTDMTRWPTEKHFTSWLTLAPKNKISGGRLLSSRTAPVRQSRRRDPAHSAVMSLGRTETALGAFYRRLAARIGKPQAVTATARKLAILVYRALKGELVYQDPGADAYGQHNERAPCVDSASAPPRSASNSSTAKPVRCRSLVVGDLDPKEFLGRRCGYRQCRSRERFPGTQQLRMRSDTPGPGVDASSRNDTRPHY